MDLISKMKKHAWYLFLLPVFFVLHGLVENFGFVDIKDCALLCLYYLLIIGFMWVVFYMLFKSWTKAALFTLFSMSFNFFYSAIHDFLKSNVEWQLLSRHGFLLAVFLIFFVALFVYLKRSINPFLRITLFLNLLLLLFVTADVITAVAESFRPRRSLSVYRFLKNTQYAKCTNCPKPNIYLLLFDEYASSLALQEEYHFQNDLDTFLTQKQFSIQRKSQSNYNFTPFSMASLLNMAYIKGIKNVRAVTAEDYSNSYVLIKENEVMKYLDAQGYETRNYSIFDLAGHPTMVTQSFLPLNTMLITNRTLIPTLRKDIGWIFINNYPLKIFFRNDFLKDRKNNEQLIELVKKAATQKSSRPLFVYAHFELPHAPFFFDKQGHARGNKTVYAEYVGDAPVTSYLEYVQYTNTRIREMANSILTNDPSAVIIILGDHGYRRTDVSTNKRLFQNMNAVYFPDKDYRVLYDSVTNVNEFPIVLNKLFGQHFPLQKDSTVLLRDRK